MGCPRRSAAARVRSRALGGAPRWHRSKGETSGEDSPCEVSSRIPFRSSPDPIGSNPPRYGPDPAKDGHPPRAPTPSPGSVRADSPCFARFRAVRRERLSEPPRSVFDCAGVLGHWAHPNDARAPVSSVHATRAFDSVSIESISASRCRCTVARASGGRAASGTRTIRPSRLASAAVQTGQTRTPGTVEETGVSQLGQRFRGMASLPASCPDYVVAFSILQPERI